MGVNFAVWLALIACIVGGVRGGLMLAQPDAPLLEPWAADTAPVRTLGVALLVTHAATAAVLGYNAAIGQGMGLALGLGWMAAAAVHFWGARKLGRRPNGAVVELLTGIVLSLPAWAAMARLAHGSVI